MALALPQPLPADTNFIYASFLPNDPMGACTPPHGPVLPADFAWAGHGFQVRAELLARSDNVAVRSLLAHPGLKTTPQEEGQNLVGSKPHLRGAIPDSLVERGVTC